VVAREGWKRTRQGKAKGIRNEERGPEKEKDVFLTEQTEGFVANKGLSLLKG